MGKLRKTPRKSIASIASIAPPRAPTVFRNGVAVAGGVGKKSVWGMGRMEVKRYGTELYPTR